MSLKDLVRYISVQETAISKLSVLSPEGNHFAKWIPFRDHFWGKPLATFLVEESVERDDKPIKAVPVDPSAKRSIINLPPTMSLTWRMDSPKILVRSEYKEAEEEAASANRPGTHVFVVCGQPEIGVFPSPPSLAESDIRSGKSVFVLYLLICRLVLELPTILQVTPFFVVLFHEGGVTQLTDLDNVDQYSAIRFPKDQRFLRIWVLIDLNPSNLEPAPIFRYGSPFFLVCTTSPHSRNTDWLDKLVVERFYMKPWSILEVIQAYVDLTFGGLQHSLSVVAPSSATGYPQNVNSGICSISLAHLPEPWLKMPSFRTAT